MAVCQNTARYVLRHGVPEGVLHRDGVLHADEGDQFLQSRAGEDSSTLSLALIGTACPRCALE